MIRRRGPINSAAHKIEYVNIDGLRYKATRNADGCITSIKRYNEDVKMWVTLNFAGNIDESISKRILQLLSEEYMDSMK